MLPKTIKNYHIEAFREGRFDELPEHVLAILKEREAKRLGDTPVAKEAVEQTVKAFKLEDHE